MQVKQAYRHRTRILVGRVSELIRREARATTQLQHEIQGTRGHARGRRAFLEAGLCRSSGRYRRIGGLVEATIERQQLGHLEDHQARSAMLRQRHTLGPQLAPLAARQRAIVHRVPIMLLRHRRQERLHVEMPAETRSRAWWRS